MEWESWVWRASGSRWARESLAATFVLLVIWSIGFGPLVEWRRQTIQDQLQPFIENIVEIKPVRQSPPVGPQRKQGHDNRPAHHDGPKDRD